MHYSNQVLSSPYFHILSQNKSETDPKGKKFLQSLPLVKIYDNKISGPSISQLATIISLKNKKLIPSKRSCMD